MKVALLVSASLLALGSVPLASQVPESDYFAVLRSVMEDTRGRLPVGGVGVDPHVFVMRPTSPPSPPTSHPAGLQRLVSEHGWRSGPFDEMVQCVVLERQGRSGAISSRRCRLVGVESHIMLGDPGFAGDTATVLILMAANIQGLGDSSLTPEGSSMYVERARYKLVRSQQGWRVVERKSLTQT